MAETQMQLLSIWRVLCVPTMWGDPWGGRKAAGWMAKWRFRDPFGARGVRLRHLGRTVGLPAELVACLREVETATAGNDRLQFNLAVNYGGRAEIVDAVRQLAAGGADLTQVTEGDIAAHLATAGLPDPDLFIRTSGEPRFSNFRLWQAADAACAFVEPCWPDFAEADSRAVLDRYARRADHTGNRSRRAG
jgi:undecaprenyl diphosphate synthase